MTTYEYRKAHGICTRCGQVKARPGRIMCLACAIREADLRCRKYHAAHPGPAQAGRSPIYVYTLTADDGTVFFRGLARDFIVQHGGSIRVKLFNHGEWHYTVRRGDKISQLVVQKCEFPDVEIVNSLPDTARGDAGFGSSGR